MNEQDSKKNILKRMPKLPQLIGVITVAMAAMAALLFFLYQSWWVPKISQNPSIDAKHPTIHLALRRVNSRYEEYLGLSRLGADPQEIPADCPRWTKEDNANSEPVAPVIAAAAADSSQSTTEPKPKDVKDANATQDAQTSKSPNATKPDHCLSYGVWDLVRHPIAYTFYIHDPEGILDVVQNNPAFAETLNKPFIRGLLSDWLELLNLKTPKIKDSPLQGYLVRSFIVALLKNKGRIDFDLIHGREGLVLSFEDSSFGRALELAAKTLAVRRYQLLQSPCSSYEIKLGVESFFVSQCHSRIYMGLGLTGLLNVMDQDVMQDSGVSIGEQPQLVSTSNPQGSESLKAQLSLAIRAEAFLENLMDFLVFDTSVDPKTYTATIGMALGGEGIEILWGHLPRSPVLEHLNPDLDPMIYKAIPKDVSGFVVSSHAIPLFSSEDELMAKLAKRELPFLVQEPVQSMNGEQKSDPKSAIAWIWDLNHADPRGFNQVGLVIIPESTKTLDSWVEPLARILGEDVGSKVAYCNDGRMILIATSPLLLTRLRETCEGTSQSLELSSLQIQKPHNVAIYASVGYSARELFLMGGGGQTPKVPQGARLSPDDEALAKAMDLMARETLQEFADYPHWMLMGKSKPQSPLLLEAQKVASTSKNSTL